jgi:nucleotide-binding universal stress UspA family protein
VYVRRVIAGVSGSARSLQALRYALELAREHDALLVPVLAWTPPGGELADRRFPSPDLRRLWVQNAKDKLQRAVDLAIGGTPTGIDFTPLVERGEAGQVLTEMASQRGDVLVIGAGRPGVLRRMMACKVVRYCLAHSACPVVAVPPPALATELHGLHGWAFRHRMHPEDALLRTADA